MLGRSFAVAVLSLAAIAGCARARSAGAHADVPPPVVTSHSYVKPSAAELASRLTPLQFEVTQNAATEPPFQNSYWNNHAAGIYVDVVTGEPLFSSRDKFESGTGWPSFSRPIEDGRVAKRADLTLGMVRDEVVSNAGGSHLGHVFDDGPPPTGMRYCINSASLRFVPADRLASEGYGDYERQFGVEVASQTPPAATSNSCALPPPGKTPGCNATLDVAIFARAGGDDGVAKPAGVLEIVRGREGAQEAYELTFDPSKLSYPQLVAAWTKGREKESLVYARTDAQRRVATAKMLRVADAVPFQRDQRE